ncbi:MAG: amidohydrolase [Woeseiaceae bacterium]
MRTRLFICACLAVIFAGPVVAQENVAATLVLRNGKIVTADAAFTVQESIAIRDDKIIYVGNDFGAEKLIDENTTVIDLNGRFTMPGMTDAHCHPFNLGRIDDEERFSVAGTTSFAEVVDKVQRKVMTLEPGDWIIGSGWSEQDWEVKELPIHDALSAASPDNPVFLYRRGGNSSFVNASALEIAGIDEDTPDPYGGQIHRKANGDPTGFLVNMGNNLVKDHFPQPDFPYEYYRDIYQNAARISHEAGLTGWHVAGTYPDQLAVFREMVDRGDLNMRVNAMIQNPRKGDLEGHFRKHRVINYGGHDLFQVRSVKVFFDGALGSRGAAFYEPYADDPGNVGVTEIPPEHLYEVALAGLKAGVQVAPHSIGIRGNGVMLDMFEKALQEYPVNDHRFRSEHAQIVDLNDVARFKRLGVIPSMQLIHATSDMPIVEDRIGPVRMKGAYAWRSFIDAGLPVAAGSDFTVESHRPLWGFYAGVTRQNHAGQPAGGWMPEQVLSREEAVRAYTNWPAYAAFLEDKTGSLEVGKYADIVVLDKDLLEIPAAEILETNVEMTIVAGEVVFQRE